MTDEELAKFAAARDQLDANPVPPPISLNTVRALKSADNRLWSPVECLRDAIKDIESGAVVCDKVLVLRLKIKNPNDKDEVFNVGYHCAGLKASEIVALLEVAKAMIMEEMGY